MIELRMLGRLSLTGADGGEVRTLLGQPRRFALLAYLAAATPLGFHRRDSLLALFWPELDQEHARTALRQALRVLRTALGSGVLVNRGDEDVGLDFGQVWSDVAALERAVDAGEWLEATDLYRGPLLEGFFISDGPEFESWLETERTRLRETASRAAQALIEQCESRGNLTTAAHWARRAVELAPNDEALVRRLISVLDHHGHRASALQAYQAFAQRLAAEYEAEPAAETQALVAAVRARERVTPRVQLAAVDLLPRVRAGLRERYRIERELARGRTATVFLAHDSRHDRPVALKVLPPEIAAAVGPERFLREIQLAARLEHPHIVGLHDSGEADGLLYFVMPYVVGESLRDRLDREPQLPITDALRIAGDVAAALGYAHGLGVVHRDIKPENILLADGRALVTDFGIARAINAAGSDRLTETGIALGTPAYMSPEQGTEEGGGGRPERPVRPRLRGVRNAHRRAAVHRPHRTSDPGPARRRSRRSHPDGERHRIRRSRACGAEGVGEGARGSLPVRRRVRARPHRARATGARAPDPQSQARDRRQPFSRGRAGAARGFQPRRLARSRLSQRRGDMASLDRRAAARQPVARQHAGRLRRRHDDRVDHGPRTDPRAPRDCEAGGAAVQSLNPSRARNRRVVARGRPRRGRHRAVGGSVSPGLAADRRGFREPALGRPVRGRDAEPLLRAGHRVAQRGRGPERASDGGGVPDAPDTAYQQSRGLRLLLAREDPRATRDAGRRLDRDCAVTTSGGARSFVCRRPRLAGARLHAASRPIRPRGLGGPGGILPGHRESLPAEPRSRGGPLREGQSDLGCDQTVRPRAGDPGRPARRRAQPQPRRRAPSSGAGLHAHRAARQGPRGAAEDARDRSRRLDGAGARR